MTTFAIDGAAFVRDGAEHRILSGALHYFRIHPAQWRRQLRMLRAMGLNTVETYVPWNLHERTEGVFDFGGLADLDAFLALAHEEGLDAIVRPGPYICAEWENGGLPFWLTARQRGRIRCADPDWLVAVDSWFDVLIPLVAARQVTRGGNVIMVQVENEYGSYGSDASYLAHLRDGLVARGVDVPLFTSDGPDEWMLAGGMIPGVLATLNFGSGARAAFETLERLRPGQPRMVMEFWDGWFAHWGGETVVRTPEDAAAGLAEALECGASVNLYMAQGGTNFGTWAGGNRSGERHVGAPLATITSYDYDAPIDERGESTRKFELFRELLAEFAPGLPDVPAPTPVVAPQAVALAVVGGLQDAGPDVGPVSSALPVSIDELGVDHGVVRYTARIEGPREALPLVITGVGDRVSVRVDGELLARLDGPEAEISLPPIGAQGIDVELVVETLGRVNYGPMLGERKGISGQVRHGNQLVHGWTQDVWGLDAPPQPGGAEASIDPSGARVLRGDFEVAEQADGWITLSGVSRAVVWVNGFCLGRLLALGPQTSLYLPWPLLVGGRNELVVLDLEPAPGATPTAALTSSP